MKKSLLIIFFSLISLSAYAQVGIGTVNPAPGSALQIDSKIGGLVPPRMDNSQMLNLTPLDGAIVYNTDLTALFVFKNTNWVNLTRPNLPAVVLNKAFVPGNTSVNTTNDTYFPFQLIAADETTTTDISFFEVTGQGEITVKKNGVYLITASFSVTNLPTGDHKNIIGLFIDNTLQGYLTRGSVKFAAGTNEWGTSGVITFPASAGQKIQLRYVLNNSGNSLEAKFFNIGISKIQ